MPINKLALVRYKTIDNCLQNRFRKWTLEDLMEACSDALYEYEGITKGISKRAIQLDIQNMRSEDLGTLNEVLAVLKQFKGFSYFEELNGMVTRLEDKLYKQQHKGKSYIDFEKNELLKGLKHIDPLHKAIINKKTIEITYQSFKAKLPQAIVFYPYLLKEYRNRWFLLGINKKGFSTMILALDRIDQFKEINTEKYQKPGFDVNTYLENVLGVSKMPNQKPQMIVMKIIKEHAPYIITKPVHPSQKILREDPDGTIFSIEVIWNFELEILGFGEQVIVLSPRRLSGKIQARMKHTLSKYSKKEKSN